MIIRITIIIIIVNFGGIEIFLNLVISLDDIIFKIIGLIKKLRDMIGYY